MEDVCHNGGLSSYAELLLHLRGLTRVTCIMDHEFYVTFFFLSFNYLLLERTLILFFFL